MAKFLQGGQQRSPQPQPKWVHGTVERVPCPHCGRANDFRNLASQQLLDTGHEVTCQGEQPGEGCGQLMEVVGVKTVTVVAVRPVRGAGVVTREQQAREATTMSPGQLQRLLR